MNDELDKNSCPDTIAAPSWIDVLDGRALVFQCPLRPDKQEAIIDLIAEFVCGGKRVLFVSEHDAALENVTGRLDAAGLGNAVLQLHRPDVTTESIFNEIKEMLHLDESQEDVDRLALVRERVDEYCDAVNAPIGNSKMNFVDAIDNAIRVHSPEMESECFDFKHMAQWNEAEFDSRRKKVEEIDLQLESIGSPSTNPFHASGLTEFPATKQEYLTTLLTKCEEITKDLIARTNELANLIDMEPPENYSEIEVLGVTAETLKKSPDIDGVNVSLSDWEAQGKVVVSLIEAGKFLTQARKKFGPYLEDAAWEYDVRGIREQYVQFGDSSRKLLSGPFRKAKSDLQEVMKQTLPQKTADVLTLIDAILMSQQQQKVFSTHAPIGKKLFGDKWHDAQSDWAALEKVAAWVFNFHAGIKQGTISEKVPPFTSDEFQRAMLSANLFSLKKSYKEHQAACRECAEFLRLKVGEDSLSNWNLSLAKQEQYLQSWLGDIGMLDQQVAFNNACTAFEDSGLDFIVARLRNGVHEPGKLTKLLDFSWYQGLVERAYADKPGITLFDKTSMETITQEFSLIERLQFRKNQVTFIRQHWNTLSGSFGEDDIDAVLRKMRDEGSDFPVQEVIQTELNAVLSIKPVFVMSPESVTAYIPPSTIEFDLVFFDEADGAEPVDENVTILRGRRTVVLRDLHRFPPAGQLE
jgi:hypothetical protein